MVSVEDWFSDSNPLVRRILKSGNAEIPFIKRYSVYISPVQTFSFLSQHFERISNT